MSSWRKNATVWINDPDKGRVLAGPCGFAWWGRDYVYLAAFGQRQMMPVSGFNEFEDWESVRKYARNKTPPTAVHRFVKTGLLPG